MKMPVQKMAQGIDIEDAIALCLSRGARIDRNGCIQTKRRLPCAVPIHLIPGWVLNMYARYKCDGESFDRLTASQKRDAKKVMRHYHLLAAVKKGGNTGVSMSDFASRAAYRRAYMQKWRCHRRSA